MTPVSMKQNEVQPFIQDYHIEREITHIHIHHSYKPDYDDCSFTIKMNGSCSDIIRGIYNYHVKERKFPDIAYHMLIDLDGVIWEGRNFNLNPNSTYYKNPETGKYWNQNAFAVCLLGNFDKGQDEPTEKQLASLKAVMMALSNKIKLSLTSKTVKYHTEMDSRKTCPGSAFYNKEAFLNYILDKIDYDELSNSERLYKQVESYKDKCKQLIEQLQKELNETNNVSLATDGIYGNKTHSELLKVIKQAGTQSIQKKLGV